MNHPAQNPPDLSRRGLRATLFTQNPDLFPPDHQESADRLLGILWSQPDPALRALNQARDRLTVADQALYRVFVEHTVRDPARGGPRYRRLLPVELYPALQPKIQQAQEARRQAVQNLTAAATAALQPRHPRHAEQVRQRIAASDKAEWTLAPFPAFPEFLAQDWLWRGGGQYLPPLRQLCRGERRRAYNKAAQRIQELLDRHNCKCWICS